MANHKRRRPKHQRAGCLMCKPWKDERGGKGYARPNKPSVARQMLSDVSEGLEEVEASMLRASGDLLMAAVAEPDPARAEAMAEAGFALDHAWVALTSAEASDGRD